MSADLLAFFAVLISIFEAKRCGGETSRPGKFAELMPWWCPQPRRDLAYLLAEVLALSKNIPLSRRAGFQLHGLWS